MARLPQAVQAQIDEGERVARELNERLSQPSEEPTDEQPTEEVTEAAVEEPTAEPVPAPVEDKAPATEQPKEDWEKRFKGMKQTHDREVSRLRVEAEQKDAQYNTLLAKVEDLERDLEDAKQTPIQTESFELSEEEREVYGDNQIAVMEKIAKKMNSDLMAEVAQLKKQLVDVNRGQKDVRENVKSTAERVFERDLSLLVKEGAGIDWIDLDSDPDFNDYLDVVLRGEGGRTRRDLLNLYARALDAKGVSTFFIDYAAEQKAPEPATRKVPEDMVQPDSKASASAPQEKPEKVFTMNEVAEFYTAWGQGKYSDDKAREIEKEIHKAQREGRLR